MREPTDRPVLCFSHCRADRLSSVGTWVEQRKKRQEKGSSFNPRVNHSGGRTLDEQSIPAFGAVVIGATRKPEVASLSEQRRSLLHESLITVGLGCGLLERFRRRLICRVDKSFEHFLSVDVFLLGHSTWKRASWSDHQFFGGSEFGESENPSVWK